MNKGEIIIYQSKNGDTQLEVKLAGENVWINRQQMAELFGRDVKTIGKHINNALYEELRDLSTVAFFATVQIEGNRRVERQIEHYNLDMVISVGYRVKSNRGIQFRTWANTVLKEYLKKGFVVNDNLKQQQYNDLKQTIKLLSNVVQQNKLSADEATGLLQVITDYTYALDTLDKYDYQSLEIDHTTTEESFRATYENAMEAIETLRNKFGSSRLFGNEKDESFQSSINTIYQTFGGIDLYPSVEEEEKDVMVKVVVNLINRNN